MSIFKPIAYEDITINNIFDDRNVTVNRNEVKLRNLTINANVSEVATAEWDNNNIWWLLFILNPNLNFLKLNPDGNRLVHSIELNLGVNPIKYLVPEIVKLSIELLNIIEHYETSTVIEVFQLNQIKNNIFYIQQQVQLLPLQNNINISLFDLKSGINKYKKEVKQYIEQQCLKSITNMLHTDMFNRQYVTKVVIEDFNDSYYKIKYNNNNVVVKGSKDLASSIKIALMSVYEPTTVYMNMLYSTYLPMITYTNKTTIKQYDIKHIINVLNAMLQTIIFWSYNE